MKKSGQVRIIGGSWRRRQLRFPVVEQLRPTPDAMRETLFNWLQADLEGSHCLDLFAGSGALGFEAASRGAAAVCLVENNAKVAAALRHNCESLNAYQVRVQQCNGLRFLDQCETGFDLIFLDPPYRANLLKISINRLHQPPFNDRASLVYLESDSSNPLPIDSTWHIIRHQRCGLVNSFLVQT